MRKNSEAPHVFEFTEDFMDKAAINKNLSLIESNNPAIYSIINAKCKAYRQHSLYLPVFPVDEPGA
ncbi:hypothetical protein ACN5L9_001215 [Cronobacter sakazakii]|uniref:hypothetical protein n=1 Tax=Cronobacter TaxID=413496 RepID=UPI000BE979AD|nr:MULTISPECIES: hypothetical protein [Cronobacter]EJJ0545494.1 hypothetical protein [Cronobacter sakazakii]ELY6081192.1 hypothetical protein [Cronobacter sakazakii]MBF4935368.1 hypothetical protein [Cronobacter sakazakii]MDI7680274.1 hypothetical protein [Cronobacter sakazakii]MDK1240179.1 hypothetical protein [Cronobacter sakazakii]